MIPADSFLLADDGKTALVVEHPAPDSPSGWPATRNMRACDTCGGSGNETMDSMLAVGVPGGQYPIGPCPDCDGTGRHTFTVEVDRPVDGWHPEWTGDPDCKCQACTGEACYHFHSFGEHCDHDSIDRHADRECDDPEFRTFRVHVLDVLEIYDHDELVDGDGLPREGMTHIEWSELLGRFTLCEWAGGGWDETPITLPPAAKFGMFLVRFAVHDG